MGAGSDAAVQIILKLRNEAEQGLSGLRSQFTSLAQSAAAVGAGLTAGVTLPLVAIGKKALDTAMDYQSAMNLFQATTGATGAQMATVGDMAIKLGADMSLPATSAADAGTAMLELAKAGLSVDQAMAAAKGTLQLAAAGQLGNAQAAEISANALNAFKLSGDQATMVADLLAAAANASSGSVYDMADSLKMASAVAAASGIPIQDVVANISQMANAGMKGSDAGTSLKAMLMSLQAPSKKAAGLMADLGLSIYDAQGTMLPMRDLIEQFSGKLGGLTQQQRNAALATIFGTDAVRAANIILMGGVDAYDQMSAAVTRQGAAQDLAAAQMKGLKGALAGLGSQIETLLLQAALPFMGVLERLARGAAELVGRLQETNPEVLKAAIAFAAVFAAAGPLALAIAGMATAMAFLLSPLGLVITGVALLAAAFAGDFMGIRTRVTDALTPVIALVDATIKIFQAWYEKTGSVSQAIMGALSGLGLMAPALQPIIARVQEFGGFVAGLVAPLQLFGSGLRQVLTTDVVAAAGGFNTIIMAVGALGEKLGFGQGQAWLFAGSFASALYVAKTAALELAANVQTGLAAVGAFLQGHATEIQTVLSVAWGFVSNMVRNHITFIVSLVQAGLALLSGDWDAAWGYLGQALQAKFGGIIDYLTGGTGAIRSAIETLRPVFEAVVVVVGNAFETVKELLFAVVGSVVDHAAQIRAHLSDAWNAAVALIAGALAAIWSIIDTVLGAVRGFLETHGADIRAYLGNAWEQAARIISLAVQLLQETIVPVLQFIAGYIKTHSAEIQTVLSEAWNMVKTIVTTVLDTIEGVIQAVLSAIRGDWAGAWEAIKGVAVTLWDGIHQVILNALDLLLAGFGTSLEDLKTKAEEAWAKVKSTAETKWGEVKTAAETKWGEVKTAIQNKVDEVLTNVGKWLTETKGKIDAYDLKTAAAALFKKVFDGIAGKITEILASVGTLLTDIKGKIEGFSLLEAGKALVQGFINGIESMAGAVWQAALGIAKKALAAITGKEGLDSHSPSRVMMQIGADAIAGFVIGIDENKAKAAQATAEAMSGVVRAVNDALGGLQAIGGFKDSNMMTQIWQVSYWIGQVVTAIQHWSTLIGEDAQAAAKQFGDNAGPVVELVSGAVELLGSIGKYVDANIMKQLWQVSYWIGQIVTAVAHWAGLIAADAQAAAKQLAENAGPVVELVSGAVELLGSIGEYVDVNIEDELWQVSYWIGQIVTAMGQWAGQISGDAQAAAKQLAENAGPVVGLVDDAINALGALAMYEAADVSQVDNLVADIAYVVGKVAEAGLTISDEGLQSASQFATAAQDVASLVKEGNAALVGPSGVAYYRAVTHETIDLFVADMVYVTQKVAEVATFFKSSALTRATETAEAMADIGKALYAGVQGLIKPQGKDGVTIADYTGIAHSTFDLFIADTKYLTGIVDEAASEFTMKGLVQAKAFAEAGQAIYKALTDGIKYAAKAGNDGDGFGGLGRAMDELSQSVVDATATILVEFRALVAAAYDAGLGWAGQLSAGILAGLPLLEAAVQAVADLFPHSPAKAGPLRREPDWNRFLLGGLLPVAGQVGQVLGGLGGASPAPVFGGGPAQAPAPVLRAGGAAVVVNFNYAPTVSLASQREAQEVIAPLLAETLRRESRRN